MTRDDTVPCEHCAGLGKRKLTSFEADTVAAVGPAWSVTADIARRLRQPSPITGPAPCNRLVRLEAMGLVERRMVNAKMAEWRTAARRR